MSENGTATQRSPLELRGQRVWVAGHKGMVGSALVRRLQLEDCQILTASHAELDLTRQTATERFVAAQKPDIVLVAAGFVGGILYNARRPADFLYKNLAIAANVIEAARQYGVDRLLYLGSSCIYPREAPQPLREEFLLSGPLEATNEGYAVAKITGLKLAEMYNRQYGCHFIAALPPNLYGPNDNYDAESSHVLAALLRKVHEAKQAGRRSIEIWGSGCPLREFLHADDLADACIYLLQHYAGPTPVNIGSGEELSIRELAELIADIVGFDGEFVFDRSKPDGTPRKLLDDRVMRALGWRPTISLRQGIRATYELMRAQFTGDPLTA